MKDKLPLDGLRDIFIKALNEIPDEEIAKNLPQYISKKQLLAEAWQKEIEHFAKHYEVKWKG